MTVLVGLSLFPFLHELIINENGAVYSWVPDWGIEKALTDANGKVLSYSSYRVFIYYLFIQCYALAAWLGWFLVSKNKSYRYALLLGVLSALYHMFLILSDSRKTELNTIEVKLIGTAIISCGLFMVYYYFERVKKAKLKFALQEFKRSSKKNLSLKLILLWAVIFVASTGPYFHDLITIRGIGIKEWVPQLGIENFLTDSEGYVWGFHSYRIFVLTLALQLFAQVGWAGWLHDAQYALYRPFLIVPTGLSLYQIIVILMDRTESYFNSPDLKLLLILASASIICYFYFFKNKRFGYKAINPSELTQPTQNKNTN